MAATLRRGIPVSIVVIVIAAYVLTTRITRVVLRAVFRLATVVVAVLVALALVARARPDLRAAAHEAPVANGPSDHLGSVPR